MSQSTADGKHRHRVTSPMSDRMTPQGYAQNENTLKT